MQGRIDHDRLLNFLGFGNPRAEAVFIGVEEGLTVPPPLEDQLATRSAFEPIMDLAESAKAHPGEVPFRSSPTDSADVEFDHSDPLAFDGIRRASTDEVRAYQRDRLGRKNERGALLEMLPPPSTGIFTWPYGAIFDEYPTRDRYRADQIPKRISLIQRNLSYGPRVVVAYGSQYWDYYKQLFPEHQPWRRVGQFETADVSRTRAILTPHFTARQMNGQRDALVDLALQGTARD